jgi:hypothetical protein
MRADLSRIRQGTGKGYTAVIEQQGRVALDADANEQRFIDAGLRQTETVDVIGEFGGPIGAEGFAISVPDKQHILIGPGRYYVDGLLVENAAQVSYDAQLIRVPSGDPDAATLLAGLPELKGVLAVYLQVWQQLVTALDDPCLHEPALGTADTTAREQTVWRVITRPLTFDRGSQPGPFCPLLYGNPPTSSTGTLTVAASNAADDCGCGPVAAAGYQGLENQLYRVEIQAGGDASAATFKWSRENGSVVAAVTGITAAPGGTGSVLTVSSLGPDANLGFQAGQWVEVTDDALRYGDPPGAAGTLYQVTAIDKDNLTLTTSATVSGIDTGRNARARRWDQSGPSASPTGIPLSAGTALELEDGISVTFGTGSYQVGDYWTFPARTLTGSVEWPPCGSDGAAAQPPTSLVVHEAPLAVLHWVPDLLKFERLEAPAAPASPAEATAPGPAIDLPIHFPPIPRPLFGHVAVEDCRRPFRPLTAAPAIHVRSISWANDDVMPIDALAGDGLTVIFDQAIPGPVNGGNFIVTLEWHQITLDRRNINLALARTVVILDGVVTLNGRMVTWLLAAAEDKQGILLANQIQGQLSAAGDPASYVRVRVRLPGEAYFATGTQGLIHLDGRALGQPGTRGIDGSQRVDLRVPSGNGDVCSDFESWFYVAPLLQAVTLTLPSGGHFTGEIDANRNFLGVVATGSPAGTVPVTEVDATVTLNYPAALAAELSVSIVPGSGDTGSYLSVPATVRINAGQSSVTVPLTFSGTPIQTPAGGQPASTWTINATVLAASTIFQNQETTATNSLVLTPATPPPQQVH